jgi:glycosyltransferase involved in cell wall biosynthesis
MKIAHISYGFQRGGAALAAHRLHHALKAKGHSSAMFVADGESDDDQIYNIQNRVARIVGLRRIVQADRSIARLRYGRILQPWSNNRIASCSIERVRDYDADVIIVHYIGNGMIRLKDLASLNKRIIFVMHDMWLMTGGCHYFWNCEKYQDTCNACPELCSSNYNDLSHKNFIRKSNALARLDFSVVAISKWMQQCAQSSRLLRSTSIQLIHHAIDEKTFCCSETKDTLDRVPDKIAVLFVANNSLLDDKKGLSDLLSAINQIVDPSNLEVWLCGDERFSEVELPCSIRSFGNVSDTQELVRIYNSADFLVMPSKQEAFGLVCAEALACGLPAIVYGTGGLTDIVENEVNGLTVPTGDVQALSHAIQRLSKDVELRTQLSKQSRHTIVSKFGGTQHIDHFIDYIQEVAR